ncbi:hypothetical protein BDQ17DRAFT_1374842 [Cyathus striatus]|nr:hypothetical protein BDQ17DRAFT_1374842 [Cyathus striatus]
MHSTISSPTYPSISMIQQYHSPHNIQPHNIQPHNIQPHISTHIPPSPLSSSTTH